MLPEPVPVRVLAPAEPAGLIVRDGDLVEASGPVEEGELCAPAMVPVSLGKIRVNMVQLTQPLYDKFAVIGLDHLILDPWIRPVGP
ncbi:hypothetical protein [Actinoplanes lobatus]|uniref:Uncharacterized protein n=1 Tax=Actinoplanes lobatus TaxID=113568 RepID=A0A7W7HG82_9ACTN|nr:hypothetical protein [Actinoplanes lobatus]MBB4749965.1 hypothetical protein [Actinoplanes lobatus]GIE39146.1 hypothetical protein Alo02nite_20440 [Actinoplanes lobatus]